MADYYVSHKAYGAYSAVPTWNTAQEGDGTTKDLATPAINSIAFSAVPTTGVISVAGASVSTTGVIGAASADAAANALATNINATTNTVTAAAAGWGTPQLRDFCYARGPANGAPAGTCQIMTRAGSATYNANTLMGIAYTLDNVSSGASPLVFSGGVSGCWGWFLNDHGDGSLWPSAKVKYTYGAVFNTTAKRPLAGLVPVTPDVVNIRANNTFVASERYYLVGVTTNTTFETSAIFLVDDGTVWTGDTGTFTIHTESVSGGYGWTINFPASGFVLEARTFGRCVMKASGAGGGVLQLNSSGGVWATHSPVTFSNIHFQDVGVSSPIKFGHISGDIHSITILKCKLSVTANRFYTPINLGNYSQIKIYVEDFVLDFSSFTGITTPLFSQSGVASGNIFFKLKGIKLICPSPAPLFTGIGSLTPSQMIVIASDLTNIDQFSTLLGFTASYSSGNEAMGYALLQNIGPKRSFRIEHNHGYLDWFYGKGYPTYNSTLPDNTPWAYRFYWSNSKNAIKTNSPTEIINLTKTNILSDGVRTITAELLLDDAQDHLVTHKVIDMSVTYVKASDSSIEVETTRLPQHLLEASAALPSSAASWTLNDYTGHVARKLELTTAFAVKANTEVSVGLIVKQPLPAYMFMFINPEIGVV